MTSNTLTGADRALAIAEFNHRYPNAYDIPATATCNAPAFDTWTVVRYVQVEGAIYCIVDVVCFGDTFPHDDVVLEHTVRRLPHISPRPTPETRVQLA